MYVARPLDQKRIEKDYAALRRLEETMLQAEPGAYPNFYPRALDEAWHLSHPDWTYILTEQSSPDPVAFVGMFPLREVVYERALADPGFDVERDAQSSHFLTPEQENVSRSTTVGVHYWIAAYVFFNGEQHELLADYLSRRLFDRNVAGLLAVTRTGYPVDLVGQTGFERVHSLRPEDEAESWLWRCDRASAKLAEGKGHFPFFKIVFDNYDNLRNRRAPSNPNLEPEEKAVARLCYSEYTWALQTGRFLSRQQAAERLGFEDGKAKRLQASIARKVHATGYRIDLDNHRVHKCLIAYFSRYPGELD